MWHKIFLSEDGIIREILKNLGLQLEDIPIFGSIRSRINELSVIEAKIRVERETLSQMLDYIFEAFKEQKKPESSQEAKATTSPEKIDTGSFPDPVNLHLEILKDGIKKALVAYKKAPPSERYREPKRINGMLELSIKHNSNLTENEHIVRMEIAIAEALKYLQTSKFAAHCKSLVEERQILEETVDRKNEFATKPETTD